MVARGDLGVELAPEGARGPKTIGAARRRTASR